jgi:hypothetical protein
VPLALIVGLLLISKVNTISIQHPILLEIVASVKAGAGSLLQRVQAAEAELETALANGKAFEAEIVELKDQLVALFAAPKPTEPTEIDPVTQAPSA